VPLAPIGVNIGACVVTFLNPAPTKLLCCNDKKVIDIITNIEYNSIKEAAKALNIERRTLND